MKESADRSFLKHQTIRGVWGNLDGSRFEIERPGNYQEQNKYYSGKEQTHCVVSVFIFDYFGLIRWCCLNYPGSNHDSEPTRYVYPKISDMPKGYSIVADSAFVHSGDLWGKILTLAKVPELEAIIHSVNRTRRRAVSIAVSSMRQPVEWSIRSIKARFGRIACVLPSDNCQRRLIFECVVMLHNFCVRTGGSAQVSTFYDPDYELSMFSDDIPASARVFHQHFE